MSGWAKKFKAVCLPIGPVAQRAALWGTSEHDKVLAEEVAAALTTGEQSPTRWSWHKAGSQIRGPIWAIIEDLEPETNEYGDISP